MTCECVDSLPVIDSDDRPGPVQSMLSNPQGSRLYVVCVWGALTPPDRTKSLRRADPSEEDKGCMRAGAYIRSW